MVALEKPVATLLPQEADEKFTLKIFFPKIFQMLLLCNRLKLKWLKIQSSDFFRQEEEGSFHSLSMSLNTLSIFELIFQTYSVLTEIALFN